MGAHVWQFRPRFRRHAFGWQSATPIQRIREALSEIKQVARKQPLVAAEGALILIEKLSPALEQVDSSSGAIGAEVNAAIATLVPIIAQAEVATPVRQAWLERLWTALQKDAIPYIEALGDYWGELCVTPELAAAWAERFQPLVEYAWDPNATEFRYFQGTTACLSALYAAGQYRELLALLERDRLNMWSYRRWGVRALVAMGQKAEALRFAEASSQSTPLESHIAAACEAILLSSGLADEAYRRYGLHTSQAGTHLATFRAIAKKYPHKPREQILRDLAANTPGAEGKWFAAAKSAGLYPLAIELVNLSSTDPRTLTRAAREFAEKQPQFAHAAGMAALYWIAQGHGYEIKTDDVIEPFEAALKAAPGANLDPQQVHQQVRQLIAAGAPGSKSLMKALAGRLAD